MGGGGGCSSVLILNVCVCKSCFFLSLGERLSSMMNGKYLHELFNMYACVCKGGGGGSFSVVSVKYFLLYERIILH